jgi:ribosomal protein S18 acetylase RimI-like enzyme
VPEVRPATPEDVDRLAELASEAVEEQLPTRGGALWAAREARALPPDDALAASVADPEQLVLVGEWEGVVAGYAAAHLEALRDGTVLAVLTDLYVEPAVREVGVGEALMDGVLRWAAARGCRGVDALVLPGNRATKNFFEGFGLVARALVVHRPLVDATPVEGTAAAVEAP